MFMGLIFGFIGFLISVPLDALAAAIKLKREKLQGDGSSKPIDGAVKSAKGLTNIVSKQIPTASLQKRLTGGSGNALKERLKKRRNKNNKEDKKSKEDDELYKESKKKLDKKAIRLQIEEKGLKATAALIRLIFRTIGSILQIFIDLLGIYFFLVIIIVAVLGYIISLVAMYNSTAVTQQANNTARHYQQGSDKVIAEEEENNTGSLWGAFAPTNEEGNSEGDGDTEHSEEEVEKGEGKGVIEVPTAPGAPVPTPTPSPGTPTNPTPVTPETPTKTSAYHVPTVEKKGSPTGNNWKQVTYSDGFTHWYQTQTKSSFIDTTNHWYNNMSSSCMLVATAAMINTKCSNFVTFDDIVTNYKSYTGHDLQYVGNGGGTGMQIVTDLLKSSTGHSDVKATGAIVRAGGGVSVDNFTQKLDTMLYNGDSVLYHSTGSQSAGLSAGGQHWITIVGKTTDGYYEVLTNGADNTNTVNGNGGRSAYYSAATLAQYCNHLWGFSLN